MDVYYHVKLQLCITSGSKVSRSVQNCTHTQNRMCSEPPRIDRVEKKIELIWRVAQSRRHFTYHSWKICGISAYRRFFPAFLEPYISHWSIGLLGYSPASVQAFLWTEYCITNAKKYLWKLKSQLFRSTPRYLGLETFLNPLITLQDKNMSDKFAKYLSWCRKLFPPKSVVK